MPFNLLLLPLIGGYFFISKWYRTKYYVLRKDKERLLFDSATAGVILLFLASAVASLCEYFEWFQWINHLWHYIVPMKSSGRSAIAFLIGITAWKLLNIIYDNKREVDRVILDKNEPLELMLRRALGEAKLVLITLKNGKIYIGRITTNFNPANPIDHIRIVPVMSGYRETTNKTLVFTSFYDKVLEKIQGDILTRLINQTRLAHEDWDSEQVVRHILPQYKTEANLVEFDVVVPRSEIQSVSFFDPKLYEQHFQKTNVEQKAKNISES
jgi:hypothetical protein